MLTVIVLFGSRRIFSYSLPLAERLSSKTSYFVWTFIILPIGLSVLFAITPVSIGRALTPFGVVCLYFIALTIVVVALVIVSERKHIPLLPMLLVGAIAFALFGLNDNHAIRTIKSQTDHAASRHSVSEGFKAWFESRKDRDRYRNTSYPIYIFAAEGGGIYAAFRTATFLTNLEDRCPRFSHHVFALVPCRGVVSELRSTAR
jgi:hypothetical protein